MTTAPDDAVEHRRARQRDRQTSARRAQDQLRTSIRLGLMTDSTVIMEHALVRALCTSRNAVREALRLLADESLVERSPRTGTRLSGTILEVPLTDVLPRPGHAMGRTCGPGWRNVTETCRSATSDRAEHKGSEPRGAPSAPPVA